MLYVLGREKLDNWLAFLEKKARLFVPGKEKFEPYQGNITFESKPLLSPKEFFLPPREPMLSFEVTPGAFPEKLSPSPDERIIFGVRACDAYALTLIKKVYQEDVFFSLRYKNTSLIGKACLAESTDCFCWAMGIDPFSGSGLDLLFLEKDEKLLLKPITEKGKTLVPVEAKEALPEDKALFNEIAKNFLKNKNPSPSLLRLKEKDLMTIYNASFWEKLSFACLNCGICTFLCPTCYCFDVHDEVVGEKGLRIRVPDSCMFLLYTQHASGHNPRRSPLARFRNRFMHKFKYFLDEYGEPLCVGCGRCNTNCPAGINLWEIIQAMGEV
ncbi:4Fe-4S dicluster domain-containing protein [Thermodesulfatator atlanticus]|uniref:4Fe-4S dicluster domain-containing protein n=1 Tax=Thermodesulfatator atlanticus TaxID=501497 RepID=UPI0003B42A84|nr:4Fe-4S dicluster domain-containing protein [Thermodesulfatator atlanticus]